MVGDQRSRRSFSTVLVINLVYCFCIFCAAEDACDAGAKSSSPAMLQTQSARDVTSHLVNESNKTDPEFSASSNHSNISNISNGAIIAMVDACLQNHITGDQKEQSLWDLVRTAEILSKLMAANISVKALGSDWPDDTGVTCEDCRERCAAGDCASCALKESSLWGMLRTLEKGKWNWIELHPRIKRISLDCWKWWIEHFGPNRAAILLLCGINAVFNIIQPSVLRCRGWETPKFPCWRVLGKCWLRDPEIQIVQAACFSNRYEQQYSSIGHLNFHRVCALNTTVWTIAGWWFGTMEFYDFPITFHILGIIIPTDELHHFSEG